MKKFIKSLWGKIVLFTVINLSLIILAVSAVGIYLMTDFGHYNFYVHNENEISTSIMSDALRSDAYTVLWDEFKENIISPGREYCEYLIRDENGNELARTDKYDPDAAYCHTLKYGILKDESGTVTDVFYSVLYNDDYNIGEVIYREDKAVYYSVSIYPHEGTPLYREMETLDILVDIGYSLRYAVFFITLASLILIAVSFVGLMYASGRRSGSDGIFPGPLFKVPFDLLLALCLFAAIFAVLIIDSLGSMLNDVLIIALICFFCLIGVNILLGLCMSAATRIKLHTFIKNTVIFKVLKLIWFILRTIWKGVKKVSGFIFALLRDIPLIWKTAITVVILSIFEISVAGGTYPDHEDFIAFWIIEKIILVPIILYIAVSLRRLQKSGEALAKGDLRHHTDTKGMIWDLKKHGENPNSISDGISIAVEERLKSERMKTELITNVSHDIKTPLTSIINYASLIGSENCGDPKINEYSEVLVRQSEKLKRL
ncbi:MAG: hypothetical protein KBT31_03970, partial [Firmicutes bacterium]|nr:hypothetical protein [Candidatus Colimorpha enterica]